MQDHSSSTKPISSARAIAPIDTVAAFSVRAFCRAHSISKAAFYVYLKKGIGPKIQKLGGRTLISAEAARAWREGLVQSPDLSGGDHV